MQQNIKHTMQHNPIWAKTVHDKTARDNTTQDSTRRH